MATDYGSGPGGPAQARRISPMHDALEALYRIRPVTVLFLIGVSMGLGLVGAQVETTWVLVVFAVFWGVTVLAMLTLAARWMIEGTGHAGQHRAAH